MLKHIPFYGCLVDRPLSDGKSAKVSHVLVYGAIEAHGFGEKGCIASNQLISKETGISKRTVEDCVSALKKAKWIHYELSESNTRGPITALLNLTPLPVNNAGGLAQKTRGATRKKRGGLPVNTAIENTVEITVENTVEILGNLPQEIPEIIFRFSEINPSCSSMYGNKIQRGACRSLIDTYGYEKVLSIIARLSELNTIPYAPTITTPQELWLKWSKLESFVQKNATLQDNNKSFVI